MTNSRRHAAHILSAASALALMAAAGLAHAEAAAADGRTAVIEGDVEAVKIIAPKNNASAVAPVKSSLTTGEPVAIIDRAFIEQNTPAIGDYTTTLSIAPSMVSAGNINGSGSVDGAKISLRGQSDGNFNITYDGIPWGDTNGPSHHANSFFPNSTIGGVVVDRGPGKATDIGQASYGGSVNLFSLPTEERYGARQKATSGSWGSWQSVTTLFSGPIKQLHDLNVLVNFQEYGTNGYLTHSPSAGGNQYIKATLPLTSKITVTGLYTRNDDHYNLSDASTGTVAENYKVGGAGFHKFGLCNDPNYACYKGYNYTKKQTDFEYLKEEGEIIPGLKFDNTTYSYWYSNKTFTANANDYFTPYDGPADVANPQPYAFGTAGVITQAAITGVAYPAPGKTYASSLLSPGIPAYLKRNEYRVTGDVAHLVKDFDEGALTLGGLYEIAKTKRFRFDVAAPVAATGVNNWNTPIFQEKTAKYAVTPAVAGCYGYPADATIANYCDTPLNVQYNEYSGWYYYQVFGQFEWRPTEKLTITPGVKYLNFELYIHAPVIKIVQPLNIDKTYDKTLGFFTANYRITPYWSTYFQASQGFEVPNISALYAFNQNFSAVQPQQSMAYQFGTVFARGKFTFDADIYSIRFNNLIQSLNLPGTTDNYFTNTGGALGRGLEVQGTYVLPHGLSVFANATANQLIGKADPVNPGNNGKQLAGAARWTQAFGLRYNQKHLIVDKDELILTLDDKFVGPQMANAGNGSAAPSGLIKSWSQMNFAGTYRFGQYAIEAQVLNVLNKQSITAAKGKNLNSNGTFSTDPLLSGGTPTNANVLQYQTPTSYQVTLKVAF
ncbi:MAG: TonB-dependent receptor [Pseudomonadota bacterium]|jgi:iron complex outermembrane receptor protein